MKLDESKFQKKHGYEEGKIDMLDPVSADIALNYKKNVLKNFIGISQSDILSRLRGNEYYVTRKYDGEYAIIFYDEGEVITVNRSGRTRRGIPCIEEAGKLIKASGISQGIFPAEIYVQANHKTRVHDLIHSLANKELTQNLHLAVFDILQINNQPFKTDSYGFTWKEIYRIFGSGIKCRPVDMCKAGSGNDILDLYKKYVEREKSEGLVVHTPIGLSFKIKPRHSIDMVVLAFTEGSGIEKGQVRSLLTAFLTQEGKYQVITRAGSGLNEKQRRALFRYFIKHKTGNPFEGMNTKYADMTFVKPQLIVEISVGDIVSELSTGEKTNFLLSYSEGLYKIDSTTKGYKFYAPVFIRIRDDKNPDSYDVSPEQINKFLAVPLRTNEILLKDVFFNEEGREIKHVIYTSRCDRLKYMRLERIKDRCKKNIIESENMLNISMQYQNDISAASKKGFLRDRDKLLVTDRFMEALQTAEDK